MRSAVLTLALAFTALLAAATVRDFVVHGATIPGVFGALVVILFVVALIGALLHPPQR